jgi:predicted 3-demethylubiquinone-9 3-methyltransferase (glyoxalase superfamily)
MPTVTPFLWFDNQAEDAMNFYASVFPSFKVPSVNRAGGQVMVVVFEVEGQKVMALNGGPHHKLTEAFSFFVACETQEEVDNYWTKLVADGGYHDRCGWLKDRFGLSWQIIPNALMTLMGGGGDPERANRVMQAMLQMQKIDIAGLQAAYDAK